MVRFGFYLCKNVVRCESGSLKKGISLFQFMSIKCLSRTCYIYIFMYVCIYIYIYIYIYIFIYIYIYIYTYTCTYIGLCSSPKTSSARHTFQIDVQHLLTSSGELDTHCDRQYRAR